MLSVFPLAGFLLTHRGSSMGHCAKQYASPGSRWSFMATFGHFQLVPFSNHNMKLFFTVHHVHMAAVLWQSVSVITYRNPTHSHSNKGLIRAFFAIYSICTSQNRSKHPNLKYVIIEWGINNIYKKSLLPALLPWLSWIMHQCCLRCLIKRLVAALKDVWNRTETDGLNQLNP